MNYVKHSDGTITYYDNQGRPVRGDLSRQSTDYYIKSDGTRINGPFDFAEPKTASMINGKPISLSQDFVKHSDGTGELPRNIPNYVAADDQLPSNIPQYNPRAEIPYLIAESPESPYYKVDAYNRPVLRPTIPSDDTIVANILKNQYGTGNDRIQALTALGLSMDDIKRIQGLVNARMYAAQARPAKQRKSAPVPTNSAPRQERTTYQGMPMNWVGPQDPEYIYVR